MFGQTGDLARCDPVGRCDRTVADTIYLPERFLVHFVARFARDPPLSSCGGEGWAGEAVVKRSQLNQTRKYGLADEDA